MQKFSFIILLFLSLLLTGCATTQYIQRPEVQAFVDKMHCRHGFDREELCELFSQTQPDPRVMKLMEKPREGKGRCKTTPWNAYRAIFLTPTRAKAGAMFWEQNEKALSIAEKCYGVPAQIIVAIIGVETDYGKNKGKFNIMNSLTNLAFDYPRRAKFFQDELEQYLLLTREQELDPLDICGSYAGAIGFPQFMPSSYRQYAIDCSGEHQADLVNNPADAILSVANYFKAHGWQTNAPVTVQANVRGNPTQFITKSLKPRWCMKALANCGIKPKKRMDSQKLAALMVFDTECGTQYWLGFKNFYVITRYNSSRYYAMAVYQLSERILEARKNCRADCRAD